MDELRKMVISLGTMPDADLRDMRQHVIADDADEDIKGMIVELIDLYLSVGEDPEDRAEATAGCLQALEEADRMEPTPPAKAGGCFSMVLVAVVTFIGLWSIC